MFEKESKVYANKWLEHVKDLELQHKSDDNPEYIRILEAHQKGAEFGYNKANEWHYVKDGEYPEENTQVLVLLENKRMKVSIFMENKFTVWNKDYNTYTKLYNVIAWKEIVLPKESE